jgi:hypothetical protein
MCHSGLQASESIVQRVPFGRKRPLARRQLTRLFTQPLPSTASSPRRWGPRSPIHLGSLRFLRNPASCCTVTWVPASAGRTQVGGRTPQDSRWCGRPRSNQNFRATLWGGNFGYRLRVIRNGWLPARVQLASTQALGRWSCPCFWRYAVLDDRSCAGERQEPVPSGG